MKGYVLSPEADGDVFQIWHYLVSEASLDEAERAETKLYAAFGLLAHNPHLGHRRSDLTNFPVLFFRVLPYSYMIVYEAKEQVEIVAVLHGKRDIGEILERGAETSDFYESAISSSSIDGSAYH